MDKHIQHAGGEKAKTIVVSAVNLRKGGTLTILRDCLGYLSSLARGGGYRVVALVHNRQLADYPGIEYIEMPWTVRSWLLRLWCEYVTMRKVSRRLSPVYLWLSLHDTTPNVKAERRAVYCHNPFPFYPWKWRELLLNYRIVCFAWFSLYIYKVNLHKNYRVVVQQQWLRQQFSRLFRLPPDKLIVALPAPPSPAVRGGACKVASDTFTFIYPSYGDIHKNFELLCRAAALLEAEIGRGRFKVVLTVSGYENKYTRWLRRKWGGTGSLVFAGFMDRQRLYRAYAQAQCLVFPSKVETWGLPISEFAVFGKPMLLADLPYAHETAAGHNHVAFFQPNDAITLKEHMKRLLVGNTTFLSPVPAVTLKAPKAASWKELFDLLLA